MKDFSECKCKSIRKGFAAGVWLCVEKKIKSQVKFPQQFEYCSKQCSKFI